jgi:hypothetical protein
MGQSWSKWRYDVRRTHIVGKAIMRWQHRMISRALQAWKYMQMNKKRLLAIVAKCVGRWSYRAQEKGCTALEEQADVQELGSLA